MPTAKEAYNQTMFNIAKERAYMYVQSKIEVALQSSTLFGMFIQCNITFPTTTLTHVCNKLRELGFTTSIENNSTLVVNWKEVTE